MSRLRTAALIAVPLVLLLTALSRGGAAEPAGSAPAASGPVQPGLVDGPTARRLVAEGVRVVDVRTPQEYAAGHVPGAVNVPFDQLAARHGEVGPPSTPVLLYCRTGRRSAIAADALRAAGFTTIYDLRSYDAWVRSEPAPGAPSR